MSDTIDVLRTSITPRKGLPPSYTFDVRTIDDGDIWNEHFGKDQVATTLAQVDHDALALLGGDVAHWLEPHITVDADRIAFGHLVAGEGIGLPLDEVARLRARYGAPEEVRDLFFDAQRYTVEDLLTPSDEQIERAVRDVLPDVETGGMLAVDTPVYWCGVLHSYPWGDIEVGEDEVTAEAVKRAVPLGSTLTFSYAGTPWARKLIAVAKAEARDSSDAPDYTFGLNHAGEALVLARAVFVDAVEKLAEKAWAKIDNADIGPKLRELLAEHFAPTHIITVQRTLIARVEGTVPFDDAELDDDAFEQVEQTIIRIEPISTDTQETP